MTESAAFQNLLLSHKGMYRGLGLIHYPSDDTVPRVPDAQCHESNSEYRSRDGLEHGLKL